MRLVVIAMCSVLVMVSSCAEKKAEKGKAEVVVTQSPAPTSNRDSLSEAPEEDTTTTEASEDDCVFNDDYKGLTTTWLVELGKKEFIWKASSYQAMIPIGQDTVCLSKGGCVHFNTVVSLKLSDDRHAIIDSVFWVGKALQLAVDFKMRNYEEQIRAGNIRRAGEGTEIEQWYEVADDNEEDNLFYAGIEINFEDGKKQLTISEYYN